MNSMVVSARPTKAFFVDMITRDLGIVDCILDLIDNAVDQAVRDRKCDVTRSLTANRTPKALYGIKVTVRCAGDEIEISDNCSGISTSDARSRVFQFGGHAQDETARLGGLSVYGIGMKRAFFKLGRLATMVSRTRKERFRLDLDVDKWLAAGDENWDLEFSELGKNEKPGSGTKVTVQRLNEPIKVRVGNSDFIRDLRARIAAVYALFIKAGLTIEVNREAVPLALPTFATLPKQLTNARKTFRFEKVSVLILASVTPREDRVPRGWYIVCNGRVVLDADKSRITGWGEALPQWHTKFGHFVGYVSFSSTDLLALPWTTTKQAVVFDSAVYQAALAEMQVQARPILTFLSKMYPTELEEDLPRRKLLQQAAEVTIDALPRKETSFAVKLPRPKADAALVNIQYRKTRKDVARAREALKSGAIPASKVGELTFEYFLRQQVDG